MTPTKFATVRAAGGYDSFDGYVSADFTDQVRDVAEALAEDLPNFTYTLEAENSEWGTTTVGAINVGVTVTCGPSTLYLVDFIDMKNATDDRDAVGVAQAEAIRSALLASYERCANVARQHALTPQ